MASLEELYTLVRKDLGPPMIVIPGENNSENTPQEIADRDTEPKVKTTRYTRVPAEPASSQRFERTRQPSLNSLSSEGSAPEVPPYNPDNLVPLPEVLTPNPFPELLVTDDFDLLPEPVFIKSPLPQLSPSPPPLPPPVSTIPLASPRSPRSKSPLPDYLVTSSLMSLTEIANPEKAALPQLFKVETDYNGREINLHRNDFIMVLFKKPVLVVEAIDSNGEKIYLSQNSKMTMCPIYNEIQQTQSMTAKQLHASKVLPPVVKVREGFVDEKGTAVEPGTLVYFKTETRLKAISRKVRKAIIRGTTSKQERLHIPVSCPGVFSSNPDHLKMYLPEIIHHCQLPIKVLLEDGVYTSDAITLQSVNVQDVIAAQRYDSLAKRKLSLHLEIPVKCPIAMVKVSLRNKATEQQIYKVVYETLQRPQGNNVQSVPNADENMYSFVYQPAEGEGLGFYATLDDWRKENNVPRFLPAASRPLPSPHTEDFGSTNTAHQHYQELGEQEGSNSTYSRLTNRSQEETLLPLQRASPPRPLQPNKQNNDHANLECLNHCEVPQETEIKSREKTENSKQQLHTDSKPPTESRTSTESQQKSPENSQNSLSSREPSPHSYYNLSGVVLSKDGHIVINSGTDKGASGGSPRGNGEASSNASGSNDSHTSRQDVTRRDGDHEPERNDGEGSKNTAETVVFTDSQLRTISKTHT